jgi:hypothetical protein
VTTTANGSHCKLHAALACNDTLDHVALLAVKSGGAVGGLDTMILATTSLTAGGFTTGTFTMSGFTMDSGNYTLYVKLVPRALMQTSVSTGLSYTR